jgi:pyridoxine 5-phosphate synthase
VELDTKPIRVAQAFSRKFRWMRKGRALFPLAPTRCLEPIEHPVKTLRLGVNIDHVATLRQARYATIPDSKNAEPDPIAIAGICERAGAHGITAHMRADHRHIQARDLERLRENIITKLNLEMGNTPEIVDFALRIVPDEVCLVPEKRQEITTEGGLDLVAHKKELSGTVKRLHAAGVRVSMFIDPAREQIDAAVALGADIVELHTGKLANAYTEKIEQQELERLQDAAMRAANFNLQVNAGHGINYRNIALIHKIPHLVELNIGHSIVARAIFVGFETAVREMLALMKNYRGKNSAPGNR